MKNCHSVGPSSGSGRLRHGLKISPGSSWHVISALP